MKTNELLGLSATLQKIPLGKLTISQRAALTRTICAISRVRKPFDDAVKEANEKLKPEGLEELQHKKDRTAEEEKQLKELIAEYNRAVQETIQPELEADVTLTVAKPMAPEELLALGDASPEMTAGDIMWIAEMLGINLEGNETM